MNVHVSIYSLHNSHRLEDSGFTIKNDYFEVHYEDRVTRYAIEDMKELHAILGMAIEKKEKRRERK